MRATNIAPLLLAAFLAAGVARAQGPAGVISKKGGTTNPTLRPKKPFIVRAAIAGTSCGVAIGLAGNPATAAEIGLPILVGGNVVAYKLYQNHPQLSAFVQSLSPLGCYLGGRIAHPKAHINNSSNSASGNGSGNGSAGSGSGSQGGTGSSMSSGAGNSTSGSGPGSNSGSASGSGSGSGSGASSGSGKGGGVCLKDCGLPGNGGVNGGSDSKPPFPGQGNGGSNAASGN